MPAGTVTEPPVIGVTLAFAAPAPESMLNNVAVCALINPPPVLSQMPKSRMVMPVPVTLNCRPILILPNGSVLATAFVSVYAIICPKAVDPINTNAAIKRYAVLIIDVKKVNQDANSVNKKVAKSFCL